MALKLSWSCSSSVSTLKAADVTRKGALPTGTGGVAGLATAALVKAVGGGCGGRLRGGNLLRGRGVPGCAAKFGVPGCFAKFGVPGCFAKFGVPGCFACFGVPGCFACFGVPGCFGSSVGCRCCLVRSGLSCTSNSAPLRLGPRALGGACGTGKSCKKLLPDIRRMFTRLKKLAKDSEKLKALICIRTFATARGTKKTE